MNRWSHIVRCLLVVSAWQGPFPVWHSHGTLVHSSGDSQPWLAEHLDSEHADIAPAHDVAFGWHVHFALPGSDGDSPESSLPSREVITVGNEAAEWNLTVREQAMLASWTSICFTITPVHDSLSMRFPAALRPLGGFFATFAPDMPLPVRLGVLRC